MNVLALVLALVAVAYREGEASQLEAEAKSWAPEAAGFQEEAGEEGAKEKFGYGYGHLGYAHHGYGHLGYAGHGYAYGYPHYGYGHGYGYAHPGYYGYGHGYYGHGYGHGYAHGYAHPYHWKNTEPSNTEAQE